jgi:hypothetical protein
MFFALRLFLMADELQNLLLQTRQPNPRKSDDAGGILVI